MKEFVVVIVFKRNFCGVILEIENKLHIFYAHAQTRAYLLSRL